MLDAEDDGTNVRHNLTEATRDMVKKSTEDVKTLAAFPAGGPHVSFLVAIDSELTGRPRGSRYRRSCQRSSPRLLRRSRGCSDCLRRSRGATWRLKRGGWRSLLMRRGASICAPVDRQGSRISHGEPRGSVELEQVQLQQQQQAQQYVWCDTEGMGCEADPQGVTAGA